GRADRYHLAVGGLGDEDGGRRAILAAKADDAQKLLVGVLVGAVAAGALVLGGNGASAILIRQLSLDEGIHEVGGVDRVAQAKGVGHLLRRGSGQVDSAQALGKG